MPETCEHPSDKIDAGGYCNALITDAEGYGDVCGTRVVGPTLSSPMPGQVYAFVDFNAEPPKDAEGRPEKYVMPDIVAPIDEANLITSAVAGSEYATGSGDIRYKYHKLIIDLDVPAKLIPSGTPGHFHLYIDRETDEWEYINLLNALQLAGIIESGYRNASVQRGYSAVRLPWVKKGDTDGVQS